MLLLDGMGAVASALFTGILLPPFASYLGLREEVLYFLAGFPVLYASFSLSCYFSKTPKSWMLLLVLLGNGFYLLLSGGIIAFYEGITSLGRLLLASEIVVLAVVIFLEWAVYRAERKREE